MAQQPTTTTRKKKQRQNIPEGKMYVNASFNNTVITFTDMRGNTIASASAGSAGFKGSRKGTAYAAQVASEKAAEAAQNVGLREVDVLVKGIGQGRESAVRTLQNTRIKVRSIRDTTGVPHNGCRPRKARRV